MNEQMTNNERRKDEQWTKKWRTMNEQMTNNERKNDEQMTVRAARAKERMTNNEWRKDKAKVEIRRRLLVEFILQRRRVYEYRVVLWLKSSSFQIYK